MLPLADVVVMIVPHTPHTERMIGAAEFALLQEGAFFINIGRGHGGRGGADRRALQTGKLGGAALDVFDESRCPRASPLWDMPNVLVSPHSASTSDRENERITELFCDNLRRFLAGAPLRNVLDVEKLY